MTLILNFLHRFNYFLGIIFFNNSNLFSNNVYINFYKKKICNLNTLKHDFISKYYNEGYVKIGKIDQNNVNKLKEHLKSQNPKEKEDYPLFRYKITPQIYEIINNIFNNELKEKLKIIEDYYNQKVILAFLTISRNYPTDKIEETYSNYFHTDGYVYNMFKIFLNVHDINEENGPLTLVKKKYAKKFIKNFDFKNRNSYKYLKEEKYEKYFFKNIGREGEMLLCSTTELIHRASNPLNGNYRDMIFLNFVALPTKEKISICEYKERMFDDKMIIEMSKIKGVKNLIKYYKTNLKNKII